MDIQTFEIHDATAITLLDVWTDYVVTRISGDTSEDEFREHVQTAREQMSYRLSGQEAEKADELLVSQAETEYMKRFEENPEVETERRTAQAEVEHHRGY